MSVRALCRLAPLGIVSVLLLVSSRGVTATGNPTLPPLPPSERVYATSVNDKIVEVDFRTRQTKTIVTDAGSNFKGLALPNQRHIVVADHNQGGKVKIFDTSGQGTTITTLIKFPSGLTTDVEQNVFVTNETSGLADEVWRIKRNYSPGCLEGADQASCPSGGYAGAQKIDGPVKVQGIPTTVLADAKAEGGRLWVLVQKPALLLRYDSPLTCSNPCPKSVAVDKDNFDGTTPTGLAIVGGEILVLTAEKRVLRFSLANASDGSPYNDGRISPDFSSNVGGKGERIAVGIQRGADNSLKARVFVTVHPKTVKQYDVAGGVGQLVQSVSRVNTPVGVGLPSSGAAATSTGQPAVKLSSVDAQFEQVISSGMSDASCFSFPDVRETESINAGVPLNKPLKTKLRLDDSRLPQDIRDLGFPNEIPKYVRAFRKTGESVGTFRLCVLKTTAGFRGLIEFHGDQEPSWLGHDPSCSNPDKTMRPRFFLSEEPPLPALLEGRVFINHSSFCQSDGADAWNMDTLGLTGARDTRKDDNTSMKVKDAAPYGPGECKEDAGVVDCQLNRLRQLVKSSSCIPTTESGVLLGKLDLAIAEFDEGEYCDAKYKLRRFEERLEASTAFGSCPLRLQPELRGRTAAALFGTTNLCGL